MVTFSINTSLFSYLTPCLHICKLKIWSNDSLGGTGICRASLKYRTPNGTTITVFLYSSSNYLVLPHTYLSVTPIKLQFLHLQNCGSISPSQQCQGLSVLWEIYISSSFLVGCNRLYNCRDHCASTTSPFFGHIKVQGIGEVATQCHGIPISLAESVIFIDHLSNEVISEMPTLVLIKVIISTEPMHVDISL